MKKWAGMILALSILLVLSGCGLGAELLYAEKIKINTEHAIHFDEKAHKNEIVMIHDFSCGSCVSSYQTVIESVYKKNQASTSLAIFLSPYLKEDSYLKTMIVTAIGTEYPALTGDVFNWLNEMENNVESIRTNAALAETLRERYPDYKLDEMVERIFKNDPVYKMKIEKQTREVSKSGVDEVPTLIVNGIRVKNPMNLKEIEYYLK